MDEMNNNDFGYECEGGYGRGYPEESARDFRVLRETETVDDADLSVDTKKEIIQKYKDLMDLWAQIVEVGVTLDPQLLNQLRQQLQALMADLKIIDKDGKCDLRKLMGLCEAISGYKEIAKIKMGYPDRDSFDKVLGKVSRDHDLIKDLEGRDGMELGDYLYGLGIIMDNEIVYNTIFENDPIIMRNGKVENGRHRMATRAILAKCGYQMSHEWLIPKTETDNR